MSLTPSVQSVQPLSKENTSQAIAGLVNVPFDSVIVTSKNGSGDPLIIEYYDGGLAGTLVATLTLTYDVDGDFETAVRT